LTTRLVFKELDARSKILLEGLKAHVLDFERERIINTASYQNAGIRLSRLRSHIGDRPLGLDSKFDASNLWLSVASVVTTEVTTMIENFGYEVSKLKSQLKLISIDPPLRLSEALINGTQHT